MIHVWAYPVSGAPPVFIGWTPVNAARPDVGAIFGTLHTPSGYGLIVRGLQPGGYTLVVFAHSSFGAGFVLAHPTQITIANSATLVLDTPSQNATVAQGFMIGGWAADFGASTGGGIDVVDVWAYPLDTGGAPIFLGAASVNVPRPDVAAYFGSQFGTAGFNLLAPPLPAGHYQIVAYGRSLVAGTFNVATTADVAVR